LQTINGLHYKTWFAGIGTGLDYYYERSVPLFVSFNKFLSSDRRSFYFNYDVGINFPWTKKDVYYFQYRGEFFPSLYWAGGFGYKLGFKNKREGILLNLGYSYKHLVQKSETVSPCFNPPCPIYKEKYDYRLRRLSLKVGWMF